MTRVTAVAIGLVGVVLSYQGALHAAPSPLEQLGRATHWLLTFVNDPYDTKVVEILELRPESAAQALGQAIAFPSDGDSQEAQLLERFRAISPKRLPRSLTSFVEQQFNTWRKAHAVSSLKLRIVDVVPMVPVGEARVRDGRLLLPVATIGRDLLRTVRDDKGLFKSFWWILSHPTYATTRPTRVTARFELTRSCSLDPFKPKPKRCGGETFFDSRRDDVGGAVRELEAAFAARLAATFSHAMAK